MDIPLKKQLESELRPCDLLRPERRDAFVNDAGNMVERVYGPAALDADDFAYSSHLGDPGAFPYTRGIDPSMYRRELPVVSAYAGFGTPEASNRRYRELIGLGVQSLSIALDLPTQLGLDADDVMAAGEVGRTGVIVSTLRDLEILFDAIPLDSLSAVGSTANAIGRIVLAMFIALGDKQRMDRTRYTVALQNDVLKEYVARGTQQIIAHEFGITSTVDPLGGAYYVESLCNHMEREIAAIVQRVDEMGGAVQAIEHRDIQKTITEDASRRQRAYERNERVSVGMNIFPARDEARRQTFRVDSDIECQQVERVRQAKHDRDAGCVREMLAAIRACAADGRNVMPALIDAVKAYATIGEICAVLKEVYGEYEPDTSF